MAQGNTSDYYKSNPKAAERRRKQQRAYNKTAKGLKIRTAANKLNRKLGTYGNGDGKDVSHTTSGTSSEKESSNRARNGQNGKSTKRNLSKPLSESKFDPADYNKNGYVSKKERRRYKKNK